MQALICFTILVFSAVLKFNIENIRFHGFVMAFPVFHIIEIKNIGLYLKLAIFF